jgi:large subunit ribosomal protein L25
MPDYALPAEVRAERGRKAARRLRRAGRLPAVLYGHKETTAALTVPLADFESLLRSGARMVDLGLAGETQKALIREVQFDALGDEVLHVDFVRVAMDEAIEVTVPVTVHGTAAGVKQGGVLDLLLHEVTVACLPGDIPEAIRIRVDDLAMGQTLHLREVPLPPGVRVVDDPEMSVVAVHAPVVEAAAPAAEAPTAPEVIGREAREEEPEEEGENR